MQYIKQGVKKDLISATKGNRFVALSTDHKSLGHFDFPVLITKQVLALLSIRG